MTRDFWKAGHPPTLLAAFLYFDVAFMVWVMLGPLGTRSGYGGYGVGHDIPASSSKKYVRPLQVGVRVCRVLLMSDGSRTA